MELNTSKDKTYRLKCPTCQKAYEVRESEIYSSEPEFECLFCREKFKVALSMSEGEILEVRRMNSAPVRKLNSIQENQRIQKMFFENACRLEPKPYQVWLQRFLKYGPGIFGTSFIVIGMCSISFRNLVGVGVATLVLVVGYRMIRSGGFHLRDHF